MGVRKSSTDLSVLYSIGGETKPFRVKCFNCNESYKRSFVLNKTRCHYCGSTRVSVHRS